MNNDHNESLKMSPPPQPGARQNQMRIVVIGASAGGLEALQILLENLPADTGAAFIISQHLSSQFKSYMDEILSKHTAMPIVIVDRDMPLEPNTIYLNAPQYTQQLEDRKLKINTPPEGPQAHFPIDKLFASAARHEDDRAIAVILSGTGSDGTKGARHIKELGGVVIVQDPQDAKFDGMPYSALNANVADISMTAAAIGSQLAPLLHHPMLTNGDSLKTQIAANDEVIQRIFWLIRRHYDVDFSTYKPSTIARRLERRIALNNLESLLEYFELLQNDEHELEQLRSDMLIGATQFFRDKDAFDFIQFHVLPEILRNKEPGDPLRIWSAGCSTGEEAYSLAIAALDAMEESGEDRPLKVFATDVDPNAISRAGAAIYPASIEEDISAERLSRYFYRSEGSYAVSKQLRKKVVFSTHNLLTDPPFSNIDLLVCRNLLIYLTTPTQRRALALMHFSMRERGYLFLGLSESLGELSSYFSVENSKEKVYRKKSLDRIPVDIGFGKQTTPSNFSPNFPAFTRHRPSHSTDNALKPILNYLANNYSPPTLAINEDWEVFHSFGDTAPFTRKLAAGPVELRIDNLIHETLKIPVLNALTEMSGDVNDLQIEQIPVETPDKTALIDIHFHKVTPARNSNQTGYLISFLEYQGAGNQREPEERVQFNMDQQTAQRIHSLEGAVKAAEERATSSTKDLESTNEELQSTNEELMTSNEELQSTNEELQSVNQELYTINSEYQEKINELTEAQNDIDKLLEMTHQAVIFLGKDLTVRRFTPAVKSLVNLLSQDIGRPITDITHQFIGFDLNEKLHDVMNSGNPCLLQALTSNNRNVEVHIRPYVTLEGDIEGLILTLTDNPQSTEDWGK